MRSTRPSRDLRAAWIGLLAIGAVTLVRASVLAAPGAPAGIDGGNWLAFGSFGRPGVAYPPLVPTLFAATTAALGVTNATIVIGSLAAAAPGIAVLMVAAWADHPALGTLAAITVSSSGAIGAASAWGGYPQLLATSAAVCAVVALTTYLDRPARMSLAVFGVAVAMTIATSHLVAVPLLGAIGLVMIRSIGVRGQRSFRSLVWPAILTAVPLVLLSPTYLALFATLVGTKREAADLNVGAILGDGWIVDLALVAVVPLTLLGHETSDAVLAEHRRQRSLSVAASALALAWGLAFLVSGEVRLIQDVAVLAPLAAVAIVPSIVARLPHRRVETALGGAAAAAVVASAVSGMRAFPGQVAFYQVLSPSSLSAIEWLGARTDLADRRVLVADVDGAPIGWWVEGITRHEALFGSDLRWLRFPSERDRARQANEVLYMAGSPDAASAALALSLGVRYLLLPAPSAFGVAADSPPAGWSIAFATGSAMVLSPAVAVARP